MTLRFSRATLFSKEEKSHAKQSAYNRGRGSSRCWNRGRCRERERQDVSFVVLRPAGADLSGFAGLSGDPGRQKVNLDSKGVRL
jgi:hypothetical protein